MALAIKLPERSWKAAQVGCTELSFYPGYRLGWMALAVAMLVATGMILASGLALVAGSMVPLFFLVPLLMAAHVKYRYASAESKIADATGGLALMLAAAILAGVISNAGLRLRLPLIDAPLARADAMLGLGSGETHIVGWFFGRDELNQLLEYAYVSSVPLCLMLMLMLAISDKRKAAWEVASSFTCAILICSVVSAFFPAVGNLAQPGLVWEAAQALPPGSGVYHLEQFNALYIGNVPVLDLGKLEGVVTFPSFHLAMALIVARAASMLPVLKWPGLIWGALTAISTIPIGGHYLVDLIVGGILWCAIIKRLNPPIAKAAKAD